MDPVAHIALMLGASWASGLNLYAAILTLGLMQLFGWVALPPELQILSSPVVLLAAAALYAVEFVADKIPGVSGVWDALHTVIRIPAGAILAAASVAGIGPDWVLAAGLVGGFLAAGTHAAKSGSRLALSASPEPFTAWLASLASDAVVVIGLWLVFAHPIVFLALLAVFVAALIWLLPKIFRLLRGMFGTLRRWMRGERNST